MIHADVHGKLRPDGTNAHDRSEDLLTSTVFGLLRYFPARDAMIPLLERVRPVTLNKTELLVEQETAARLSWIGLGRAMSVDVTFWPSFGRFGQPDILLTFRDSSDMPVHRAVVEAKLHSPKSGEARDDSLDLIDAEAEAGELTWNPDQLVRYWKGLLQHGGLPASVPRSVVYLTAHATPPVDELRASLRACPTMRLAWMSWHDVWHVVSPLAGQHQPLLAAVDLTSLLATRGFKPLDGFKFPSLAVPETGKFWRGKTWFGQVAPLELGTSARFWELK